MSDADELLVTGLRQTVLRSDARGTAVPDSVKPPAAAYGLESWESDEAPESELPVPAGELLGGRYTVERMFAQGGMGVVCLGRHAQLDQPVAIKFLRRALAGKPAVVQRFLNEARALAALRSEHVVRVMDVGQLDSGRPYLVMEHLTGIDLDALVERDGPLDVETAVSYVIQVCEPMAEAHALGIVHRDLKPENLFLWTGGPAKDIVKVLDFGLAKHLTVPKALAVTGPQDSMGSPCYMSPEQIVTPHLVDSRTDIWSLGVVLYRLLSGTLPFDGSNLMEVLSHVLSAVPKPLTDSVPELDAELDAIVLRCLEKKPEDRYATMFELGTALSEYLEHRRQGVVGEASSEAEPLPLEDEGKIRIAGVHRRWPGVLALMLVLAAGAVYQADRTGRIRVRDRTDGWLTPARMAPDAPRSPLPAHFQLPHSVARGVFAVEPTHEADGALALRAEPELEVAETNAVDDDPSKPMGDAERTLKQAAYREYLRSQGLTPLREILPSLDANATP